MTAPSMSSTHFADSFAVVPSSVVEDAARLSSASRLGAHRYVEELRRVLADRVSELSAERGDSVRELSDGEGEAFECPLAVGSRVVARDAGAVVADDLLLAGDAGCGISESAGFGGVLGDGLHGSSPSSGGPDVGASVLASEPIVGVASGARSPSAPDAFSAIRAERLVLEAVVVPLHDFSGPRARVAGYRARVQGENIAPRWIGVPHRTRAAAERDIHDLIGPAS